MMKYIIDIPDEHESDFIAETPFGKRFCFPWRITDVAYSLPTHLHVEEYTEPDRKAIEDEVWEFATICTKMDGADSVDVFGGFSLDSFTKYSYQEAKAKYDAWKKSKEEIHVGDEVKFGDTNSVVVGIDTATEDSGVNVVCRDGNTGYIGMAYVTKTGRHFPEIEELLKKMEED